MTAVETSLSELLNRPKATLATLRGAHRILLRRQGAEDLVLTTAARAKQDHEVMGVISRMLVEMTRTSAGRSLALDVLPAAFPWARYLPAHEVREFSVELDNTAAVAQVIAEWRHTAEVHADPELYAALTTDSGEDFGSVPLSDTS
ncbi:hypothetical protein [Streptomyces sp. NBC_01578]|uniref:hypothetical protein n=1 Tax=Streptomyces sp. NBC_01578 TaxID=2975884 RepID=UPI003870A340